MKISCKIIEDLLPLYVDQVASCESRELVEAHVQECTQCRKLLEEMQRENAFVLSEINDEKRVLKKIRRVIRKRNVLAAVISAAIILAVLGEIGYLYHRRIYFSWEGSGLQIEDNRLVSTERNNMGRFCSVISPDQKKEYLMMYESMEIRHRYPEEKNTGAVVMDFNEYEKAGRRSPSEYVDETSPVSGIQEVYYVGPEYVGIAEKLWEYYDKDPALAEEKITELEANSTLIWKADNS